MSTKNFFAVSDPDDSRAVAFRQARKAEYEAWREAMPDRESLEGDFLTYCSTVNRSTGISTRFIETNLMALTTLDKLPRLRAQIESEFHVDMARIRGIDKQLSGIHQELVADEDFWAAVDERLCELLSASRIRQLMPTNPVIAKAIRSVVLALEPSPEGEVPEPAEGEGTEPEADEPEMPPMIELFRTWAQPDGSVSVEVRVGQADATKIEAAVRGRAKAGKIPMHRAFLEIFLESVSVEVALNLYKASDVGEAPGFLQPFGPLPADQAEVMAAAAKVIRDTDVICCRRVKSYHPDAAIRAVVQGRDGTCRWPGCTVPAIHCQLDHRVNFAVGGPTTASEMISLCQRHHNRKTDGQARYFLCPVSGDVIWLFNDGTWAIDGAQGPLAPAQRRWVQTLAQKAKRRRDRARNRRRQKENLERSKVPEGKSPLAGMGDEAPF